MQHAKRRKTVQVSTAIDQYTISTTKAVNYYWQKPR
jgi:hypothetical protein